MPFSGLRGGLLLAPVQFAIAAWVHTSTKGQWPSLFNQSLSLASGISNLAWDTPMLMPLDTESVITIAMNHNRWIIQDKMVITHSPYLAALQAGTVWQSSEARVR